MIVRLGAKGYLQVRPIEEAEKFPPSQIWKVEADELGRISIPGKLIEPASFGKKVTWFGQEDYLELRPQEPKTVIEVIRDVLRIIEKEAKKVIGK